MTSHPLANRYLNDRAGRLQAHDWAKDAEPIGTFLAQKLETVLLGTILFGTIFAVPGLACSTSGGIKEVVLTMSRSQQTFYLENSKFATALNQLGLGLSKSSYPLATHKISMRSTPHAVFHYVTPRQDFLAQQSNCRQCVLSILDFLPFLSSGCAQYKHDGFCFRSEPCATLFSVVGIVYVGKTEQGESTTWVKICKAKIPGAVPLQPSYQNGIVDCGSAAEAVQN